MKPERTQSVARKLCCLGGVLWTVTASAQAELDGFAPAVNGPVTSVAAQADGKVVIGGMFTEVNGVAQPYLARLNADGSIDTSFTPAAGPAQFVNRVAISQSRIFVSGGDGIRRFSEAGALDWHYPMYVTTFAVDSHQRVVFGGRFVRVDNQYHRNLARLTPEGFLDPAFAPVIGCCAGDGVDSILALNDKILVGGVFQSVNDAHFAQNLARIDANGVFDGTFAGAADPLVLDMAATVDGHVYRVSEQTLARHLPNGTIDPGFAAQSPAGFDERFLAVADHGDGVLVGGNFTFNTGGTRTHLARFMANGSLDASFTAQPNGAVRDITVQADGSVIIAGDFTEVDGQARSGVARITRSASPVAPALTMSHGATGIVISWPASASDGKLEFRELNGNTWTAVGVVPVTVNGRCCVTNLPAGQGRIYRLVRP
jgi:uncharacterized delta-60 repeat protein